MGDPQHYQPLSQALNPPTQPVYSSTGLYQPSKPPHISNLTSTQHRAEEEEEEEEDDEDEGQVEEQLNTRTEADNHGSNPASPHIKGTGTNTVQKHHAQPSNQPAQPQDPSGSSAQQQPQKRRPGRPRGSKNRKPRVVSGTSTMKPEQPATFFVAPQNQTTATPQPQQTAAPPTFPEINPQNHHYYEFQWRVLNLCAEFYGAAEELVKATPPLVVAQCYQMMPESKVDPLSMLADAKRICDTLLKNPARLILNPPPPMYPTAPIYQGQSTTPSVTPAPAAISSTSAALAATAVPAVSTSAKPAAAVSSSSTTTNSAAPGAVITNPQSFVVSMGQQTTYPHSQYGVYTQYPSYYPPSYPYTSSYYQNQPQLIQPQVTSTTATQAAPQPQAASSSSNAAPAAQPQAPISSGTPAPTAPQTTTHGAWSDEEIDRLKKLVEESRLKTSTPEQQWDWVVQQFSSRSRHQILLKASNLGLRETPTRGVKRRRENEAGDDAGPSHPPPQAAASSSSTTAIANISSTDNRLTHSTPQPPPQATASPSQPHATLGASPALQHAQRPPSTSTTSNTPTTATAIKATLPWPMPTVAANTPSPVMVSANLSHVHNHGHGHSGHTGHSGQASHQDPQRATSHYRPRTMHDPNSKPQPTTHSYMYQPNGSSGRLGKDGGK